LDNLRKEWVSGSDQFKSILVFNFLVVGTYSLQARRLSDNPAKDHPSPLGHAASSHLFINFQHLFITIRNPYEQRGYGA
jgi:hypothetical protein